MLRNIGRFLTTDQPVTNPCARCGADNSLGARFCNQCAPPLVAAERATPGSAAARVLDAERKQVTVLFSDLTGYTTLSERLDPEETREIMTQIFSQAAEVVGRYGGRIEKFIGDAIMGDLRRPPGPRGLFAPCDAGTSLRVQFLSSPGGSTSRLELEIASESPTTWPRAA